MLRNALSASTQFRLSLFPAEGEVRRVAQVVAGCRRYFARAGVTPRHIESLGEQIDRLFSRDQRVDGVTSQNVGG